MGVVIFLTFIVIFIVAFVDLVLVFAETKYKLRQLKKYPLQFKFVTFKDLDSIPYVRVYYRIKPTTWPWYTRACPEFYEWDTFGDRFKSIEEAKARAAEMVYPYYFAEKIDTQILELND